MFSIQLATENDIEEICAFDHVTLQSDERKKIIWRSVINQNCYISIDKEIMGYAVLEYTFYETGFVSMLYVHPDYRHNGIGSALMRHLESLCQTNKLFTSTNLSNLPMQHLLAKLKYKLSGTIQDLDENDPELIYVKYIHQRDSS